MKKKILIIFLCVLFFNIIIPVQGNIKKDEYGINASSILLEGGWLEKINGINILHLSGSFYEMGYQQGYLLKEEIVENLRAYYYYFNESFGITYNDLLDLWNIQKNYVSQDLIDFIQGTADGADLPFHYIALTWIYEGEVYTNRCCSFSAWGSATQNNELYFARSLDYFLDFKDPVTGKYVQENPVLIVADPENGYAYMYPTLAGYVIEGGVNEKGVTVSAMWSDNNDRTKKGTPRGVRFLEILNKASTAEEAIDILTKNKTFGYNFLVSDGDTPIGYALETTANHTYIGTWDNLIESTRPFWKIDHVVRRTNCYLNPKLTPFQRVPYNPRSLRHIFGVFYGRRSWFITWLHYKSLSNGIEHYWGNIDLNKTMEILRGVYNYKYDLTWRFFHKIWEFRYDTVWQWAAYPKNGGFLVSYADVGKSAWECPVNYFNFFSLLDSEPPP